ncbi:MAG TPA: Hsp20/alpha crystallin family protein, partial [Burkholderiaceae bacterium]|nr:Hsp20/alpha crystallin family protein [Burkholderiaceae bacterium]
MSSLMTRGGLFDEFFKDIAPGFYVRPLHGDPLPSP